MCFVFNRKLLSAPLPIADWTRGPRGLSVREFKSHRVKGTNGLARMTNEAGMSFIFSREDFPAMPPIADSASPAIGVRGSRLRVAENKWPNDFSGLMAQWPSEPSCYNSRRRDQCARRVRGETRRRGQLADARERVAGQTAVSDANRDG